MTHAHHNVYSVVRYEEDNTCNPCIYAYICTKYYTREFVNVFFFVGLVSYYNYDLYFLFALNGLRQECDHNYLNAS